jgi:hypothetical protein
MTGRHYAHLSPNYVAETVGVAFGNLGIVPEITVTMMRRGTVACILAQIADRLPRLSGRGMQPLRPSRALRHRAFDR